MEIANLATMSLREMLPRTPTHQHEVIFVEELGNDGKDDAVCEGCDEPVVGPTYRCLFSKCKLLLHKSCAELPRKIRHRLHPNHTLILQVPQKKHYCDACCENCSKCFFYRCTWCNFDLDIKCASRWQINPNDCLKHAFVPISEQVQFNCQVCGEESKDIAYLCTVCRLLVHHKCAQFQRTIRITAHEHQLSLAYSLHDQDTCSSNKVFCRLCYKKVNKKSAIYSCKECSYIVDLNCPRWLGRRRIQKVRVPITVMGRSGFANDPDRHLFITLEEDERGRSLKIKHFSHKHDLILSDEKLEDDKLCEGCTRLISAPFYSCTGCNFFLHERCAILATTIERHPLHIHPITFHLHHDEQVFWCDACDNIRHGFVYKCDECPDYRLDIQCCSIPECFEHEGHQHPLYLAISSKEKCSACDSNHEPPGIFVCTECDFALGFECAILPLEARYDYDEHLLKLAYAAQDGVQDRCKEYYCLICEEKREPNHWFYYCVDCDFSAHTQCVLGKYPYVKLGRTLLNTVHRHPIAFVPKTKPPPPCGVCGEHLNDTALECTECKLIRHITCKDATTTWLPSLLEKQRIALYVQRAALQYLDAHGRTK